MCVAVWVYFQMTRLAEPVDLTVKNGEDLFSPHSYQDAGVQTLLFLDEGCVCLLCLSSNPLPLLLCGHGGSASDNPVLTQLDLHEETDRWAQCLQGLDSRHTPSDGGEATDGQLVWRAVADVIAPTLKL